MTSTTLAPFIKQLQDATTPPDAAPLLQILVDNRTQSGILALIQLLDHANPAIADLIARSLEQLAPDSVEALLVAFDHSIDHGIQARIVQILANIGDDRALELLVEMVGVEIANHCQGNVRRIAARGLGRMLRANPAISSCKKAIDKLIWALLHTEDWALRYAAAVSLGEIATEESIMTLQQALLQESDRLVQKRIHFLLSA
jgi:bilin biosynthesis PecF protein